MKTEDSAATRVYHGLELRNAMFQGKHAGQMSIEIDPANVELSHFATEADLPIRAEADWPSAVMLGGSQTGVVAGRDLSQRGVRVVFIDCENGMAFRTRYGAAERCPNPDEDASGWLDFMLDLGSRLGNRPILLCSSDRFVAAIADHADALATRFRIDPDAASLSADVLTKERQYVLAAEHGMPIPRTEFARARADAERFAAAARFPCLIKPLTSRIWERFPERHRLARRKVVVAQTAAELLEYYSLAAEVDPAVVLQEVIIGPDTNKLVYLSCYSMTGERLVHSTYRVLRASPMNFGSASIVESTCDAEAEEICDAFLSRIGFRGICEIELKRDERDGEIKMIEANPRCSGTGDAAAYTGLPLAWVHYLDAIGESSVPLNHSTPIFRHATFLREWDVLPMYFRSGELTLRQLWHSYRRPVHFFDLDARDWRPTLSMLGGCVTSRLSAMWKRLRSR